MLDSRSQLKLVKTWFCNSSALFIISLFSSGAVDLWWDFEDTWSHVATLVVVLNY